MFHGRRRIFCPSCIQLHIACHCICCKIPFLLERVFFVPAVQRMIRFCAWRLCQPASCLHLYRIRIDRRPAILYKCDLMFHGRRRILRPLCIQLHIACHRICSKVPFCLERVFLVPAVQRMIRFRTCRLCQPAPRLHCYRIRIDRRPSVRLKRHLMVCCVFQHPFRQSYISSLYGRLSCRLLQCI